MIDRPNRGEPKGFGKRGTVTMNRMAVPTAAAAAVAAPTAEAVEGGLQMPKWVIGGVAAAFLLMMVTMTGGIGGGGFLGGLLGGLLAGKIMNSGSKVAAPNPARAAVPPATTATAPAANSVSRGGFGTTASSPSHSSGGFSFGG